MSNGWIVTLMTAVALVRAGHQLSDTWETDDDQSIDAPALETRPPVQYTADWTSLDSRPLPTWYDDAKFGIFIHWGVYSVPAFGDEWFWMNWKGNKNPKYVDFMRKNYKSGFTYAEFAPMLTAELYEPDQWADILATSGAKYVVITSKHHDGYTLWPSRHSPGWNAGTVGPRRDLLGDLARAVRQRTDMRFGLYHSLYEWFNPLYHADRENQWTTRSFVDAKVGPILKELVETFEPSVIWSDGDWEAPDSYWQSTDFLAWLYNHSPVRDHVVVNDRWGNGSWCQHGGFYSCSDRYNPGTVQPHKWENCFTIDKKSWGYRRNAQLSDYHDARHLIAVLVETVSCGGNFLLNIGPTADGRIIPIFEERLGQVGAWLGINGQAIYHSRPWVHQNDTLTPNVWYTATKDQQTVYAIVLEWPLVGSILLAAPVPGPRTQVEFLGYGHVLWMASERPKGIRVIFPARSVVASDWTWVIRLTHLHN